MKRTIYLRLLLTYLLYGILVLVIVLTFTQKYTHSYMVREEARQLYQEAVLMSSDFEAEYPDSADFSGLSDTVGLNSDSSSGLSEFQQEMEMISDYLGAEIWLINSDGQILADSEAASARVIPDFSAEDFGDSYYMTGSFYQMFRQKMLTVCSPITIDNRICGYILIHKTSSSISSTTDDFVNISFCSVLIVFVGSLLLTLWNIWAYFRPISEIARAAESYAKGDFSRKIEIHGNTEITDLADTLNYMASEMGKLEEDQRKFVSNVSHDFRSPLTSIRGYIVAMMDGTIPVEFQERYLGIILHETDRLTKLTESLLELSRFGKHGVKLELSKFDINQMIRTTVMTFEGTCRDKNLNFDLVPSGNELYVRADASKIQQVLYNLIDNAVKFSGKNTSIRIATTIRNGKVIVSVKDHGIGIPAESMNKIWERFYKTDPSRGRDKRGSGLGLSIVREIISAHEENISCVSTEGIGTEFTFTLPLAASAEA